MATVLDGRLIHQHTATGSYHYSQANTAPLMATTTGLRYSLSKGKKGMSSAMQKASRSSVALAIRRNSSDNVQEDPACENMEDDPSAPVKPSGRPSRTPSGRIAEMIKIFVLLLEPKTKTFELIQLVYPSAITTIGDILRMIPQHATELTLGSQKYTGLCRPKEDQALSNLTQLASAGSENAADSASVCSGEILVAIPSDYSVPEVAKFSQAILTNRRFTKLLRRNNPLAPKMRKHSDRKKDRKHHHKNKHRSRDSVHILERHDEAPEDGGDDEQMMQRAMEKAANAAAQANANIPGPSPSSTPGRHSSSNSSTPNSKQYESGSLNKHLQKHNRGSPTRSDSASVDSSMGGSYDSSLANFSWIDGGASTYSVSTDADSIGESLSSWSKSLDASFAKTGRAKHSRHRNLPSNGPPLMSPRNPKKSRSTIWFVRALAVAALAYLVGSFLLDPQHLNLTKRTEAAKNSPMGLPGLLLVITVMCVLKKIQFLANRRQRRILNKHYIPKPPHQSLCPAVRIHAKWTKLFA